MSFQATVARGLKWQAVNAVGRQVLSFAIFASLARLLGPEAFGLVGLVVVYLALVAMIADQGISASLIQREDLQDAHLHTAYWFNLALAVILCAGTIAFAQPVEHLLGAPGLAPLLAVCSLTLVINALSAIQATLCYRRMDFRGPALRNLLGGIVGGAVGVAFAFAGAGVWALVAQQIAGSLVATGFLCLASDYRPAWQFSLSRLRELFGVSLSVFGTSLLWFAASRVDQIVIGRVLGPAALGFYVIAGKVPNLLRTMCHQPLGDLSLSALSRLQSDPPRLREVIYKGMELNALVSIPLFVGLAAVAPTLVPLLFGEKWTPSAPTMQMVTIYVLLQGLAVYFHPALLAARATRAYLAINVVNAGGAALACGLLVSSGVASLVGGLMAVSVIAGAITLFVLKARIGLSPARFCGTMAGPAFAAALMYLGVTWLEVSRTGAAATWTGLVVEVVVGMILYAVIIAVVAGPRLFALGRIVRDALLARTAPVGA